SEDDGDGIRQRLLVRRRDQGLCPADRDPSFRQAPQRRASEIDQALSANRKGRSSHETKSHQAWSQRPRKRAQPAASNRSLHQQQGNERFPYARSPENCAGSETKEWSAISLESLARGATDKREEDHIRGPGEAVRETEPG